MNKALVTGGAGYKGTLLVKALLDEGFHVTILDNFLYGFDSVMGFAQNKNFHAIKKDIRNIEASDVKGFDFIFHLAGISGYPACEANPHSAQTINVTSTDRLVKLLGKEQILAYASTTSIYGSSGQEMDEESKIAPVSLYGVTTLEGEKISMERQNSVSLRFATLFGVSYKMRCDLLLNDFVNKAVTERSVVLFDCHSVRTFLHVSDAIESYMMIARDPTSMCGEVYNVGANNMNYSKLQLTEKIKEHTPFEIIKSDLEDPDRRDFIINFNKIQALGFKSKISMDDGIKELLHLYSWYRPYTVYRTI
ncbi:MAG: SDR family oxidoreductase [Magnetococcales bacterium]|nr:SDR family oxidoreductase [Magnetococcales bacterium]